MEGWQYQQAKNMLPISDPNKPDLFKDRSVFLSRGANGKAARGVTPNDFTAIDSALHSASER